MTIHSVFFYIFSFDISPLDIFSFYLFPSHLLTDVNVVFPKAMQTYIVTISAKIITIIHSIKYITVSINKYKKHNKVCVF